MWMEGRCSSDIKSDSNVEKSSGERRDRTCVLEQKDKRDSDEKIEALGGRTRHDEAKLIYPRSDEKFQVFGNEPKLIFV
jgi:hypothetical protein